MGWIRIMMAVSFGVLSAASAADMIPWSDSLGSKGYALIAKEQAVCVYRLESAEYITLAAEGTIAAPPGKVRQVLLDYESHVNMVKQVVQSRILDRDSDWLVVYQRLELPIISDRDQTLLVKWGQKGKTLWMEFQAVTDRGPPERGDAVRICRHVGSWQLKPMLGGLFTRARYQVTIDLAGTLPKWMARGGAADEIPALFASIRKTLAVGP